MAEQTQYGAALNLLRQECRAALLQILSNSSNLSQKEYLRQMEAVMREYRQLHHQELEEAKAQWRIDSQLKIPR